MLYLHSCNSYFFKVVDHSLQMCQKCGHDLLVNNNKGYFIEFLIINQMISFFKRIGFYESLQYRFKQNKISTENIEDIYDGLIYQKHFNNYGFLANPDNILFLWNIDGVPLFNSSKISIWSIFLIINGLEPSIKFKSENIIFAGIWYSSKKPEASLFLEPIYKELKFLKEEIKGNIPTPDIDTYSSKLIKAILIAGTFDLTARCLILGTVQFNGKYVSVLMYLYVVFSISLINLNILFAKLMLFGSFRTIVRSMFEFFLVLLIRSDKAFILL